ncbi:ATP-dependent DNA helicase [Sporolactobacillus sp. CPB3-1]|uniref:ATP-dependent DNA helicase n=1 Tax=Sporolactobacillus mangiferae TaxID=2940498 RepID=A0ABT0MAG7_9BACL|nr:ATP-dependent DNA helicase RecQ [Sporolactobacillus mangiferae]MCL1631854.1 ATP-dependent DNA helicase [Sporolactobacillus mangiferae]
MKQKKTAAVNDQWIRAKKVLQKKFGFRSFRNGQEEIIRNVLAGKDVFAMMPTGSGKSLCYQLPGYVLGGIVLIVSPLLALMDDQIHALRAIGEVHVRALNSMMHREERARVLSHLSDLRFLYISPEMLNQPYICRKLAQQNISLFVVDEAHCVSQWGHEFRPDYLHLAEIRAKLGNPSCLAVTATADHRVRQDIIELLGLREARQTIMSVDRSNIALAVRHAANDEEKMTRLVHLIKKVRLPGIIYCASREWTERLADYIRGMTGKRIAFYHGGMDTEDRRKIQGQFLNQELELLCCTSAFGMGLNKSDIRLVVHFHFPGSMNAYLQEIGRAARDGNPGLAVLYYTNEDHHYPEGFIDSNFPDDRFLQLVMNELDRGHLKVKSKEQFINDLKERGAGDTAARFIFEQIQSRLPANTYLSMTNNLRVLVRKRRSVLLQELAVMEKYLKTHECRRAFCLSTYQEQLRTKPEQCCDQCGIDLSVFGSDPETSEHKYFPVLNWKKRLAWIFDEEPQ